jgi:hypothetical protein
MLALISLIVAAGAGVAGYAGSKGFTRRRLRFVDAVHTPSAPLIAGGIAALAAAPVVWILTLVGAGTALCLGAGVALGVKSAQRDRHLLP